MSDKSNALEREIEVLLDRQGASAEERSRKRRSLLDLADDLEAIERAWLIEGMREDLPHLPNLTDEDLWEIVQTT